MFTLTYRFGGIHLAFGARYSIKECPLGAIIGNVVNHTLYGVVVGKSFFGRHVATWAN